MKWPAESACPAMQPSLPVRGAWVEIFCTAAIASAREMSLPVRGAWVEIVPPSARLPWRSSLPVRGAWVEIKCRLQSSQPGIRRSPCGERGLKFIHVGHGSVLVSGSLPVRGAWVEIGSTTSAMQSTSRRSPCGERGLKFVKLGVLLINVIRRSPCGERGLKWHSPLNPHAGL